jgi:hypothetical protein
MKKIIKDFKNFVNENYYSREDEEDDSHDEYTRGYDNEDEDEYEDEDNSVEDVAELYRKYGDYPYACDAIAYYIFGEKNSDNKLLKAYKGQYGRNTEVDETEVSSYMLNYEYSWEENIEDIDNFIMNLPTKDGEILSLYY